MNSATLISLYIQSGAKSQEKQTYRRYCRRIWTDGTDLGSIESTGGTGDNKYNFQLLDTDVSKLPTDVAAGSTALVLDTGDVYIFHKQSEQWKKL